MYPVNMAQPAPLNPSGYVPGVPPGVQPNPNQGMYAPTPQMGFKVRPVGSYDEAKAVPTDFLGNMLVLTDLSHGKIYTKVLDPATGSPIFKSYSLDPDTIQAEPQSQPQPIEHTEPQAPPYDAKSEIDRLRTELNHIKQELGIKEETT